MTRIVAIHQPNFFPWLGYFDKIARSDIFVFLDHVQFPKTGGTWTNRVKLLIGGREQWVTAPVVRDFHGVRAIANMEFERNKPWKEKFIKSLTANYAKAPFYRDTATFLEPLVLNPEPNVSRYNCNVIMTLANRLGLSGEKFRWSSTLNPQETSNEMLISLARLLDCDTYMCGSGARGYQDDALFFSSGVRLVYQDYRAPIYDQVGQNEYLPGLSIVDALMNCGFSEVASWLHDASIR